MSRSTGGQRRDAEVKRRLAAALTHEDALLVSRALDAYAGTLGSADRPFPNPNQRAMASRAIELAKVYHEVNVVRGFMDEQNEGDKA